MPASGAAPAAPALIVIPIATTIPGIKAPTRVMIVFFSMVASYISRLGDGWTLIFANRLIEPIVEETSERMSTIDTFISTSLIANSFRIPCKQLQIGAFAFRAMIGGLCHVRISDPVRVLATSRTRRSSIRMLRRSRVMDVRQSRSEFGMESSIQDRDRAARSVVRGGAIN